MKNMTKPLPIPDSYAFDDTPKAFKRMLQRKNGDQETYKKMKQQREDAGVGVDNKRSRSEGESRSKNLASEPSSPHRDQSKEQSHNKLAQSSLATGFKTVRAKRKAHLQARDLKKKLKRFDSAREQPSHPSNTRKHVRDVVQEPPKLHQPKKTFKKVKDEREEIKSWSDYEDELEAEETMKALEKTKTLSFRK